MAPLMRECSTSEDLMSSTDVASYDELSANVVNSNLWSTLFVNKI